MSDQSFADSPVHAAPPALASDRAEPVALTAASARFSGCRWHKPADAGLAAHCTHRDVLPVAGVAGFNADAWCADCGYYKLRRTPRKATYS